MEDGMVHISVRRPQQLGPGYNISKLGTEDGMDNIQRRKHNLFSERYEVCGQNTLYVDYMTII